LFSLLIGFTSIVTAFSFMTRLCIILAFVPLVSAAPKTQPFPNLPFKVFSGFVEQTFGPNISLATVLLLLFTMTENPELLSLHARQQHPAEGENKTVASGWIRSLSCAIMHRLKDDIKSVLRPGEYRPKQNHQVSKLSVKLDAFAKLLNLTPYDHQGKFKERLQPVSYIAIQAVHAICPDSITCVDQRCASRALLQTTRPRDVPLVTLIKDNIPYEDVPVLSGKCMQCGAIYYSDHERFKDNYGSWTKCYLNSARFLKIGQSTWVDRNFTHSVLSGMYNFHASASAYTQHWNDCASVTDSKVQVTRRHIWQAFVQESIRTIASVNSNNLELPENLNIEEVTQQAFKKLGNEGVIEPGKEHSCSKCCQPYKDTADFMANEDPAAVIGADENSTVPVLTGEYANLSAQDTTRERQAAQLRANNLNNADPNAMDVSDDDADCSMIILDGVVMGPQVIKLTWPSRDWMLTFFLALCSRRMY
jgi:CxC5 like cysteine cluster associated with KDZ transposases